MSRGDRYDDRVVYERERDYPPPPPRGDYERDRFTEDDRYYMRGGKGRDYPDDHDRYERYDRGPPVRTYEEDYVRDRRPAYEEPRFEPRREPLRDREPLDREFERRVVISDRERDREREYRDPSPRRRPRSDIFDRRPEYPPPARYEDIRRDQMPPPPRPVDPYYDDDRYAERSYYRDDDRGRMPPEHVHEREIIRERERDRSRESRATRSHAHHSRHSHSPLSSRSSSHSRSGGGTSVRSEYPKKGKTRIPARLVSKKVIIDIGYPFTEEGSTIIIQRALGQDHIDEVLKLSEEHIRREIEISGPARSEVVDQRREEVIVAAPPPQTVVVPPPPAPAPAPAPAPTTSHSHAPVIVDARPPSRGSVDVVENTIIYEGAPSHHHHGYHHHHHDGALVVRSRSRSTSRSRSDMDEWRTVHRGHDGREIIRTERMEDGQLVIYEEVTDRIASHKPPRIEKDKKGPNPGLLRAMLTTLT